MQNDETKLTKGIFVSELRPGNRVDDFFLLSEIKMGVKRDGSPYLQVTLSDNSGRIQGVVWDNAGDYAEMLKPGDIVRVKGAIATYRGSSQVIINAMEPAGDMDLDPSWFLPSCSRDVDSMMTRLLSLVGRIDDPDLKRLLNYFFSDSLFVSKFKRAPGAKLMHHAYIGGLLEHTLSISCLAERVAPHYQGIDKGLLITGAILHDIGKIREFHYDRMIDYSDEGRLFGHIVIGHAMISAAIDDIGDFPEEKAKMLLHIIVSHHGSREFGSPEPPKTLEALLLYYLDEIDAKINGVRDFINKHQSSGTWSDYHKPLARFFYTGKACYGEYEK